MKKALFLVVLLLSVLLMGSAGARETDIYTVEPPTPKGYDMPYTLTVYIGNQMVVAYDGQTGEPVRYMICSTGKGNLTPRGTFTMPATYTSPWDKWGNVYVRYPTTIKRPYYFHSILYSLGNKSLNMESWNKLGTKASHGCVRMTPLDAQWINYNCKKGTRVRIVNDKAPGLSAIHDQIKANLKKNGHSSVQPTLKPTPVPPPPVIEPGSTHTSRVKALQKMLRQHGFYNGAFDGKFVGASVDAWNAYQKARGWTEDSIASTEEQQSLAADTETIAHMVDLKSGDTGLIVLKVEERLRQLGYFSDTPNQSYDKKTVAAVKKYQLAAGIAASGKLASAQQPTFFSDAAPTPTPRPPLSIGSKGSRVKSLQTRLFSLGFYSGSATGKYQAATASAVKAYQEALGVEQTGQADDLLQARIASDNSYVGTARTLKSGAKGIIVRVLEEKLLELGFFTGKPDHVYDAATVRAVKGFQSANGLAVTGIAVPAVQKQILEK